MLVKVVGVTWYRPEEYKTMMAMFEDGADFPDTYEGWLSNATHGLKRLKSQGLPYEKAILGPQTFPDFCRQFNLKMNSDGRAAFAANYVRLLHENGVLHPSSKN